MTQKSKPQKPSVIAFVNYLMPQKGSIFRQADDSTFSELEQRYAEVTDKISYLDRKRKDRTVRAAEIVKFVDAISTQEPEPDDFSEDLWTATIDHLTTYTDSTLGFAFMTGEEVRVGV